MKISSYHDRSTGLEQRRIMFDDQGNYVCEINWQHYFDHNPSNRRAEVGEQFLEELKKGLENVTIA